MPSLETTQHTLETAHTFVLTETPAAQHADVQPLAPIDNRTSVHKTKYASTGPFRAKLIKQGGGGRRYFDSGEFAMVVREGKAPDDILVQDLYLSDVATLTPRWKCAPDVDRPKTHKPSRLSASSSA